MSPDKIHTRASILTRLRATLERGEPIVAAAAGAGIVAKCADVAGVDLIFVISSSKSRHLGVPTTIPLGNAIDTTLAMYAEVENVVEQAPIIGGLEATDLTRRRLQRTIRQFVDVGFDGITNFPSAGAVPWGEVRNVVGDGVDREYEMIGLAHEAGVFAVGQAHNARHATSLAEAGADLIVVRCGPTAGGLVGPVSFGLDMSAAAALAQEVLLAARAINPDVFVIAHGGPFARPADTEHLYTQTDIQGIMGESAIERLPIEDFVSQEVRTFRSGVLRPSQPTAVRGI